MLSALGLIHAYSLSAAGVENNLGWMAAPDFFAVYLVVAAILWVLGRRNSIAAR